MEGCPIIFDCIACITSALHRYFILTGTGNEAKWNCVPSLAVLRNVQMTIRNDTMDFCPPSTTIPQSNIPFVTYISFAIAVFCLIGIFAVAFWAKSVRRVRRSPPPIPPRPSQSALYALTSFARRRQQERETSLQRFNVRNLAFQRELADRLDPVRRERDIRYPGTPRNTPAPLNRTSTRTTRESTPDIPSRSYSTQSSSFSSSFTTPIMSREATPAPPSIASRDTTPAPLDLAPIRPPIREPSPANVEHIYDSPNESIYASISNSPALTDPISSPQITLPPLPPIPSSSRPTHSSFGRRLKKTSLFKSNP